MGNTERVVGDFELSLSPKNEREIASSCSSNKPNNTYNWMHPRAVDRMHASSQLAGICFFVIMKYRIMIG